MTQIARLSGLSEVEAAIEAVRFDFIKKLHKDFQRLSAIVAGGLSAEPQGEGLEEAILISHRIAGVASTFGYPGLGGLAREAESVLTEVQDGEPAHDTADGAEKIRDLSDEIAHVCQEYGKKGRG